MNEEMNKNGGTGESAFDELEAAMGNNNYQEALNILRGLKVFMPDSPEIVILQAKCFLGMDKPLDALFALKKMPDEEEQDMGRLDALRMTYEALFLVEPAIETVRTIIDTGEETEAVYSSLAGLLLARGSSDEAVEALQEGLNIFPRSENLRCSLALCYLRLKEREKALALQRELETEGSPLAVGLAESIERANRSDEENNREVREHLERATEHIRNNEVEAAVRELVRGLRKDPTLAVAHTRLGYIYDSIGLDDAGFGLHQRALELDPGLAEAHTNIGYGLQKKGDLNGAIAEFEKALELDPMNVGAYNSIGVMYDKMGDFEKGIGYFKQALNINPRHPTTLINLGFAYRGLGNIDESIPVLEEAVSLRPDPFTRFMLASSYRQAGRFEEASPVLASLAQADPESLQVWLELALCRNGLGDVEGFAAAAEKASALSPKKPADLFMKAQVMELFNSTSALECWKAYAVYAEQSSQHDEALSYARERIISLENSINEGPSI